MSAAEHAMFVARLDDPVRKFNKDLKYLCDGCAALSKVATKHAALQTWIHDMCPMTVPKPSGAGCVKAVDCHEFSGRTPSRSAFTEFCFDSTYRNPSYDTCFGHTLMSVAQTYDRAVAIASGVVLLLLLLLFARVWVVHRVQEYQDTLRDATVQTPVDNA
ncbi:hypothetical protein SDRG_11349 [Saprolegnia diclina VS20]|uniref:Uncharacterized protein n=1 Tax=Saprolegnia diclina (strain VS20) TaxID=1156394 RepID=T0RF11_SAPDV|nr:hypothetical protein SDRG_11349 [Saprolegnia diclina VS20]EQC30868.1 hypothetical protein SDRG_11349 [Saprolegnia diclina VS20]|eukprot:XP_008615606.1 hypothetical protein SDRG_11349 [Saprolegnia diclina VS20]